MWTYIYFFQVNIQGLIGIAKRSCWPIHHSPSVSVRETTGDGFLVDHTDSRWGLGAGKGCLINFYLSVTSWRLRILLLMCLYRTCHGWMYGASQRKTGRGEHLCNSLFLRVLAIITREIKSDISCHVLWSSVSGKRNRKTYLTDEFSLLLVVFLCDNCVGWLKIVWLVHSSMSCPHLWLKM